MASEVAEKDKEPDLESQCCKVEIRPEDIAKRHCPQCNRSLRCWLCGYHIRGQGHINGAHHQAAVDAATV